MKKMVDIASELAIRLSNTLQSAEGNSLIDSAIEANPWFTRTDIHLSIRAIITEMLESQKIEKWMAHYPALPCTTPRKVGIIMAGNIPLVGFADLLCTLMAGHQAWVKPSSKDKVLTEHVIKTLKEIEPAIPIYIYEKATPLDAVIATGGTEANRHFEQSYKNIKRLLRSSRHSIAVLSGDEGQSEMKLLSEDIYAHSGLGCRNVAMIFAPKGIQISIPARPTNPKYHNNFLQTRALLSIKGESFEDNGTSVIIKSHELPHSLSTITLYEYNSLQEVEQWIGQHDSELQCIVSRSIEHPRRVDFGQAQHPTLLDYADGVDTMKFLEFNN